MQFQEILEEITEILKEIHEILTEINEILKEIFKEIYEILAEFNQNNGILKEIFEIRKEIHEILMHRRLFVPHGVCMDDFVRAGASLRAQFSQVTSRGCPGADRQPWDDP